MYGLELIYSDEHPSSGRLWSPTPVKVLVRLETFVLYEKIIYARRLLYNV